LRAVQRPPPAGDLGRVGGDQLDGVASQVSHVEGGQFDLPTLSTVGDDLMQTTTGQWMERPSERGPRGHHLLPYRVLVGTRAGRPDG
jgi:hypothetical protein